MYLKQQYVMGLSLQERIKLQNYLWVGRLSLVISH
jgi:hypothetical protein